MTEPASLRRMGVWGAAFVAFNGMIGAGIFGLPGKLDQAVGAFAPWLLLFAGMGVMLVALCYADLAGRFDRSGGPQLYATAAFGPFIGFQAGWLVYASRIAATAANATVLAAYASALWNVPELPVAMAAILIVTLFNLMDLIRVTAALGGLSLFKLLPLLLLVVLGIGSARPEFVFPQFDAVEAVALAALYAFVGFEAACIPAGETRDPRRAIPRALLLTVALVTMLYFLIQLAYHGAGLGASDRPLAELAHVYMGTLGAVLLALTAILSVFANISSAVTATPRLTSALADDGMLPAIFGRRLANGAPVVSILVYGTTALLLAATGSFVFLAIVSSLARLFSYASCAAAVPVLDHREGVTRPLRGILIPGLAVLLCIWAASQSSSKEWSIFAAFFVAGSLLFFLARRSAKARG